MRYQENGENFITILGRDDYETFSSSSVICPAVR